MVLYFVSQFGLSRLETVRHSVKVMFNEKLAAQLLRGNSAASDAAARTQISLLTDVHKTPFFLSTVTDTYTGIFVTHVRVIINRLNRGVPKFKSKSRDPTPTP